MSEAPATPSLRRAMGMGDVVLFFVTTGTNLQWVATAAAAGPSALVVWIFGIFAMALPLAFCVTELSSRYPEEGGLYVWSKRAFGDFAGFMTGWTYWTSNLPYFPGVLYFAAANLLYAGDASWQSLSTSPAYFIWASILGLGLATVVNLVGLDVGKWLTNMGAITRSAATLILVGLAGAAWLRFGVASPLTAATLRPGFALKDLVFWSTIAFALTGFESASFMGDEVKDSRRTIPRGLLLAAPLVALLYFVGTASVLVALPADQGASLTSLQGIMQGVHSAALRTGLYGLAPLAAVLIAASSLGSVGAWLGAVSRIPFVAGIDHALPASFGRLHPRWGTPYVAILTQSGITVLFILLGQAGTSVRGAYGVLVSMTILVTFIPFLGIFGAAIKLQAGSARRRGFGLLMAVMGLLTTAGSIVLSVVPAADEPDKLLAVVKVLGGTLVLLGIGVVAYLLGRRKARRVL
jgi:amino acid transporter